MQTTIPDTKWTADPRVPALLNQLRETPPTIVWSEVPSISCRFGRDKVWSYSHPAIEALQDISEEYFAKLDYIEAEQGYDAYYRAARHFFDSQPSIADLVERVEAERLAA